ncbi:AraC family transcriptional regulator [Aurantimonas sp. 22II-16-19i]|uniref:helix-turn-helix transcriptional regulator n=1 Tax=Aurantimonas sp. 22II-16-19i TaxID=1317114 RepID=UPI00111C5816|nr:AraC family transcriptional regulator [Aurantimonas sp. 22II-16-19i]
MAGSGLGSDPTPIPPVEQTSFVCVQFAPIAHQSLFKLGKLYSDEPYPESSIEIIHLEEQPEAIVPAAFDCFHLEVPDAALRAFADAQHRKDPGLLRCRKGEIDTTMRHLAEALLPVLERAPEAFSRPERLFFDQIVCAMLAHLSDRYAAPAARLASERRLAPWQQRLVTERLTDDLRGEPALEDLARLCGLPVLRFAGDFRRTTGLTPARWLRRARIEAAKQMLFRTTLPLKEIAFRCGFADHSHFTRVFSAEVGMIPAAFRRER